MCVGEEEDDQRGRYLVCVAHFGIRRVWCSYEGLFVEISRGESSLFRTISLSAAVLIRCSTHSINALPANVLRNELRKNWLKHKHARSRLAKEEKEERRKTRKITLILSREMRNESDASLMCLQSALRLFVSLSSSPTLLLLQN